MRFWICSKHFSLLSVDLSLKQTQLYFILSFTISACDTLSPASNRSATFYMLGFTVSDCLSSLEQPALSKMFTLKFHLMIYYPTLDCCSTGTNTPDCTSCVCHWCSSLLYSREKPKHSTVPTVGLTEGRRVEGAGAICARQDFLHRNISPVTGS